MPLQVNPDFTEQVKEVIKPEQGGSAVLYCSMGGSLEAMEQNSNKGLQSR